MPDETMTSQLVAVARTNCRTAEPDRNQEPGTRNQDQVPGTGNPEPGVKKGRRFRRPFLLNCLSNLRWLGEPLAEHPELLNL